MYPFDLTITDLNADGILDLAVANYGGGDVSVLLGLGDGTFSERTRYSMGLGINLHAVVVADFDRDGHADLAVPELFTPFVRRGVGDGTFLEPMTVGPDLGFGARGGAVADFNRDGWPDLAFAGTCDGPDCDVNWVLVYVNWTAQPERPCVVQDLAGLRMRDARQEIGTHDCRKGAVRRRHSRRVPAGRVIRQRPAPGRIVPSGTRVDLVLSLGPR